MVGELHWRVHRCLRHAAAEAIATDRAIVEPLHLLVGVLLEAREFVWEGGHGQTWADFLGLREWSKLRHRVHRFFGSAKDDRRREAPIVVKASARKAVAIGEARPETPEELLAEGGLDRATRLVLSAAGGEAERASQREVRTIHILVALLANEDDLPFILLEQSGIRARTLRELVQRDVSRDS